VLIYFSADTIFNSASSARIHAALPIVTNRERRPGAPFTQTSASRSVLNNLVCRTRADPTSSPINCRRTDRLTSFFPASARFFLLRIRHKLKSAKCLHLAVGKWRTKVLS